MPEDKWTKIIFSPVLAIPAVICISFLSLPYFIHLSGLIATPTATGKSSSPGAVGFDILCMLRSFNFVLKAMKLNKTIKFNQTGMLGAGGVTIAAL